MSDTNLDNSTPCDDISLDILGYILVRSDHPYSRKPGDICTYYKDSLPLKVIDIFTTKRNFVVRILYLFNCLFLTKSSQDEFETIYEYQKFKNLKNSFLNGFNTESSK